MRIPLTATALLGLVTLLAAAPGAAQDAQSRLWDAAISGDTLAIRQALADGAKIDSLDTRRNPNGRRALNWAAIYNRVPAIEMLLAAGAPIEGVNRTGFTALNHAGEEGSLDATRALLAAGADPAHANNEGYTPAQTARENGHEEVAALIDEAAARGEKPAQP